MSKDDCLPIKMLASGLVEKQAKNKVFLRMSERKGEKSRSFLGVNADELITRLQEVAVNPIAFIAKHSLKTKSDDPLGGSV